MTTHTPVTDMVRECSGDYLAAVEALERSHAMLLRVLQDIVGNCPEYNFPGTDLDVYRIIVEAEDATP